MLKRVTAAKIPYETRLGNRVRAVSAFVLLLCIVTLALFLRFDGRERSLAYELLCFQFPFLGEFGEPGEENESPSENDLIVIEHADIDPGVGEDIIIKLKKINLPKQAGVNLSGPEPRVLIYHTHATEAYRQTEECVYVESSKWRTLDKEKSVVAVGERLAEILSEQYGINVIHDTTNHEQGESGSTSYDRSLKTMKQYKERYPSIIMFIDVHRDSGSSTEDVVIVDGKRVARMMFVVGTGEGATGTGFNDMPDFESNFSLAKQITEHLLKVNPNLMRDIRVKTGRYNQHMSNQCLLIEVGHNYNSLSEALAAMDYFAAAIANYGGSGAARIAENEDSLPVNSNPEQNNPGMHNEDDGDNPEENPDDNQIPLPLIP